MIDFEHIISDIESISDAFSRHVEPDSVADAMQHLLEHINTNSLFDTSELRRFCENGIPLFRQMQKLKELNRAKTQ